MIETSGNNPFKSSGHSHSNLNVVNIIEGCIANNRKYQQQLFEWLNEYAIGVCYRYATNITEVQDLVSDGFMKVYKNIQHYNGNEYGYSEASFKGWFKRVLINNCINYLKKYNHPVVSSDYTDLNNDSALINDEDVITLLHKKDILMGVKSLPPSYKTVFSLFAIDGYTHEEISNLLGISIGASKSNLFKARQHLQKYFAAR